MEDFSGTTLFWLIAMGAGIGMVAGIVIKKEGVTVRANMIWGIIGSVGTGAIFIFLELGHALLFAFVGTQAILFLVNAFHLHHQKDIFGDVTRGIRIRKAGK